MFVVPIQTYILIYKKIYEHWGVAGTLTYRLSAKVLKTKAYIVDDGLKMIIPNILSINRSRDQTAEKVLENSSFEYELEGYHDATVGTIVFNRTILPRNRCPDSRWTIISL